MRGTHALGAAILPRQQMTALAYRRRDSDPICFVKRKGPIEMLIEKRELYSSPNGDRWFLSRDSTGRAFIRHEANPSSGGQTSDIDVGAFLSRGPLHPEHHALLRLISTLVDRGE